MDEIRVTTQVHFREGRSRRKEMRVGAARPVPTAHVQRVTRLMALAIRMQELVDGGIASDYAELARLNQVSRARITQIMNLLLLAPDIQEAILNLPEVEYVRDEVGELRVRAIASVADWGRQRRMWAKVLVRSGLHTKQRHDC